MFITHFSYLDIYKCSYNSNDYIRSRYDRSHTPHGLFLLPTGDMYTSNLDHSQVYRWIHATATVEIVTQFSATCTSIFVSVQNVIYCSMPAYDRIVTKLMYDESDLMTVVAGSGVKGSAANMLVNPQGIFVNTNLDLYVADTSNDRIQLFRSNTVKGTTIAGIPNTISLNNPTSVVLDANNYIYILDTGYNRIVSGTSNGFRCIVSCGEESDSSNQLTYPSSMAFDSFGNLYVTDSDNDRVQKFLLSKNTFGEFNRSDIGLRYYFNNILFSHTNRTN